MNAFMIAAPFSGGGKTTVTTALLSAYKKRKKEIVSFKTGPDYIDPQFHRKITGNVSINLDTFLNDENTIRYLFKRRITKQSVAIIEGVMGIFDGFDMEDERGSSAYLAKLLNLPVILVIDAKGMSKTVAAIIKGITEFDKNVNIAGVILNKIGSKGHFSILKEAIDKYTNVKVLGYLENDPDFKISSRHLGLMQADEINHLEKIIDKLGEKILKTVDFSLLDKITYIKYNKPTFPPFSVEGKLKNITLGIAKDEAFSFYYDDNLSLLEEAGAKIRYFSPIYDKKVPAFDALYLGGGYPEIYAEKLAKNKTFLINLKEKSEEGLPIYAECGGMLYLSKGFKDKKNRFFEFTNFFDGKVILTNKLQNFGYVEVETKNDIHFPAHEFHFSKYISEKTRFLYTIYKKRNGEIVKKWKGGNIKKRVLAGYPHVHFYSSEIFFDFLTKIFKKEINFDD